MSTVRFLLMALGLSLAGPVSADDVFYIGTNAYPVIHADRAATYGITLHQFNLDGQRNLEAELSRDLPMDDLQKAEEIANARVAAMDPDKLRDAFRGVALALQWDIRQVPAFVFGDGQAVIYGLTDVDEALSRWEYYRSRTKW